MCLARLEHRALQAFIDTSLSGQLISPSTTFHFTASRFARRRLLHLSGPRTPPAAILCPRECGCVFAGRRSNVEVDTSISRTCPLAGKSLLAAKKAVIRPALDRPSFTPDLHQKAHEVHRHFGQAQYRHLAPSRSQKNLLISVFRAQLPGSSSQSL